MISPAATATTELTWRELAWRRQARQVALATAGAVLGLGLSGCMGATPVPMGGLNRQLEQAGNNRNPSLAGRWLALINGRGGRDQVLLLDLDQQRPVPVPGLNRPDALPISVSVDVSGDRIVLIRQLEGRSELVLYRRSLQSLQPIAMAPPAVPVAVQLRADGRELALQVSRDGLWQVDLIQLP